jgi:hypothetical protein
VKIQVFEEDDAIKDIEFELEKNSQTDPTEIFKYYFQFDATSIRRTMSAGKRSSLRWQYERERATPAGNTHPK